MIILILAIIVVYIIFSSLSNSDSHNGNKEADPRESVKKVTDQDTLRYNALNDDDWYIRRECVKNISDKKILERIALNDDDSDVRQEAVNKISNQKFLENIALNDENWHVRCEAIKKINSHNLLQNIAVNDDDIDVIKVAQNRLRNIDSLITKALNDKNGSVRGEAVRKITDQDILKTIALTDSNGTVRKAAVNKPIDQNNDIVQTESTDLFNPEIDTGLFDESNSIEESKKNKIVKINNTTDFSINLEDSESMSTDLRGEAVRKITDQDILKTIALTDSNGTVRKAAVNKPIDQNNDIVQTESTDLFNPEIDTGLFDESNSIEESKKNKIVKINNTTDFSINLEDSESMSTDLLRDYENQETIDFDEKEVNQIEYSGEFSDILISENAWKIIRQSKSLRKRLNTIVSQIEYYFIKHTSNTKKIQKVKSDLFKIYWDRSSRILFSIKHHRLGEERKSTLLLSDILSHDEGVAVHTEGYEIDGKHLTSIIDKRKFRISNPIDDNRDRIANLWRLWRVEDTLRLSKDDADLQWWLDDEQKRIKDSIGPILLKGSAGSGKTTIGIYRLIEFGNYDKEIRNLYVTYTKNLKEFAKKMYLSLLPPEKIIDTEFLTIQELCFKIISDQSNYPIEKKVNYDEFERLIFLKKSAGVFEPNKIWEEIRGVIKGAFLLIDNQKGFLSNQQYLEIPKKQALFTKDSERNQIYRLFEMYEDWKEKSGKWDDLDLSFNAFQCINKYMAKYDQVIADEIQDFTSFQLNIVSHLCTSPDGLFLTGDAQQMIHPSRFEWRRTKELIFKYLEKNHTHYNKNRKISLEVINKNYRSPKEVVELCNRIYEWRNENLGENNSLLEYVFEGELITYFSNELFQTHFSEKIKLTHRIMVLTPSSESNILAENYFPSARIFSIQEAKGLESPYIILFNFFSDKQINFDSLQDLENDSLSRHINYIINLLNVSVSRAQRNLIFIDEKLPDWFTPIQDIELSSEKESIELLGRIYSEKSTDEDYINFAIELEDRGLLIKASENYFEGNDQINGNRCMALHHERHSSYKIAAGYYENALMINDAVRCYEKNGNYNEAFYSILNANSDKMQTEVEIHLNEYITNMKKLAKLSNMGEPLANSIVRNDMIFSIEKLFDYSLNRTRLLEYNISKSEQAINPNITKDIKSRLLKIEKDY